MSKPRRIAEMLLVCVLAVTMLGASSPAARYNRIGHNLMCVCGCGQVLLECNHVGCPDSARMINELCDQTGSGASAGTESGNVLSGGTSDQPILKWFEAKYGAIALAAPIRGGFDNLAWFLPFAIFLFATVGTALLIRAWARGRRLEPVGVPVAFDAPDSLRERIRRETEWR